MDWIAILTPLITALLENCRKRERRVSVAGRLANPGLVEWLILRGKLRRAGYSRDDIKQGMDFARESHAMAMDGNTWYECCQELLDDVEHKALEEGVTLAD